MRNRTISTFAALCILTAALHAQPRLSFSGATVTPGAPASVNVNLIGGGMNPAALQVSFAVPAGATITPGPALPSTALFGSFINPTGLASIVIAGITTTVPDGVVATISFPGEPFQFAPVNALAVDANANKVTITAAPFYFGNPCDLTGDGLLTAADIQAALDQVIGKIACTTADLTGDTKCTVVDIQRVVNAVAGAVCKVGQ